MSKYFGTDGFRGEAGITLTADHAYKVGRFLGWYYNALRERNGDTDPARIVIGKDTRRSSYMFEYSLVAGLTASGADAYQTVIQSVITHPEERIWAEQTPRRQPWIPDASKIKHDKMKQFCMIDMERKRW